MKKFIAFTLLVLPFLYAYSVVYPKYTPSKPLKSLTTTELNQLFDEANATYKQQSLKLFADDMCTRLNGSMLIAKGKDVLLKRSSGYKKLNAKRADQRIADTTCFELASVSKQFTAMAILQLADKGKLDLSDPVTKFFPELPYSGVTVRHLLTHTSGLPEYFDWGQSTFGTGDNLICNDDVVRVLARRRLKLIFRTGSQYKYTNTNYMLLAAIVKKVSGMSFENYMAENIFKPAGMTHSFYVNQRSKHPECSIASGHYSNGAPLPLYYLDGSVGDKGMYSNVNDLFLWKKALFDDFKILPEKWVEAAILPENILKNGKFPEDLYGYGFHLEDNPSYGMLVYHGGLWRGFHHVMLYYPNEDIFVVFLSNYCNRAHRGKNMEVLRVLCGV